MNRFALFVLLLVGCAPRPSQRDTPLPPVPWTQAPDLEIDLRAWQETESVPLLGRLRLVIDLFCGPSVTCEFVPTVPEGFTGNVQSNEFEPLGRGRTRRFVLDLRPVRLGAQQIPPFRAEARLEHAGAESEPFVATTKALAVSVASVLGDRGEPIEAPAPPFGPRLDVWLWLALGCVALLLILALLWWRRRPERRHLPPDETPLPAHVTALRALARLRSASRGTPEEVDGFYVEVSRILRIYLEQRFGLQAPERTTEEFLGQLNAQGAASPLNGTQRNALAGFLRQCDLVKFARMLPGEEVHAESLRIAEVLVEETRADRMLQEVSA